MYINIFIQQFKLLELPQRKWLKMYAKEITKEDIFPFVSYNFEIKNNLNIH